VVDFRYHALSLMAVFMALGVGLLAGVAIGDSGLASSARDALRDGLRGDVERVRTDARALEAELERRDRFERRTYATVVAGRLRSKRVGLVFLGDRDGAVHDQVRAAIEPAGGELAFVAVARGETVAQGRRAAEAVVRGERVPWLSGTAGDPGGGVDGIVIVRGGAGTAFDEGVADGLRGAAQRVVGVELSTTAPSHTGWYRAHDVDAVDNVDQPAGMASLVLILAGEADGVYGGKPGAADVVPDALGR
jgi:hypothetical protein